jgi:hypothetical protein
MTLRTYSFPCAPRNLGTSASIPGSYVCAAGFLSLFLLYGTGIPD